MTWIPALFATVCLLACGGSGTSIAPSKDASATTPEGEKPGVKPDYVKCDPAHPEMPCTPDIQPE